MLKVLSENVVAVRTKAIRCLTLVMEADPGVLSRTSLQTAVHARLLDQSTAVREACVELIGKFILCRPELISQYYTMLSDRILVSGECIDHTLFCEHVTTSSICAIYLVQRSCLLTVFFKRN